MISPGQWLESAPLQAGEQLFAVLGNASDCKQLETWRSTDGSALSPIRAGSAYLARAAVTSYVAVVAL